MTLTFIVLRPLASYRRLICSFYPPALRSISSPLLPSIHPSFVCRRWRLLYEGSDEVCSLKVCLLDWLMRCLVRVSGEKAESRRRLSMKWGSRVRPHTLQSSNERSGSRRGAPRLIFDIWTFSVSFFLLSLWASSGVAFMLNSRSCVWNQRHAKVW